MAIVRRGISRVANRSGIEDVVGIVILLVTRGRVSSNNLVVTVSIFNVDGGSFLLICLDSSGRSSEALRHWLFFCGLVDGGGGGLLVMRQFLAWLTNCVR